MKKTNRMIAVLLPLLLAAGLLTGCGAGEREPDGGKLSVVASVFPIYDWVRQISDGTDADVTLLLDSGVDLHSYQPTADDVVTISGSDLFIYVGGESDSWARDVLRSSGEGLRTVSLLETLGEKARPEETVEGMEAEEHGEEDDGEAEYDEHVWLSLKNAALFCEKITEELCSIDPDNAGVYQKNSEAYIDRLEALDGEYAQAASSGRNKTLIFADRFPFRYLTEDYGLGYYAAFSGCSSESSASFETIVFLADKAKQLGVGALIRTEGSDGSIAEAVREAAGDGGMEVLVMDSLQTATLADADNGLSYLSAMQGNLETLRKALD